MSLYNMFNGVNPATFFILPMLGEKHPDNYPRFRDCFVNNNEIHVYTRVGGGNRNCEFGEDELQQHPNYLRDFDDAYDSTYATYVFSIPCEFKNDFDLIISGKMKEISETYKERIYKVYPKLKDTFDKIYITE
jgi:hypothetical protein